MVPRVDFDRRSKCDQSCRCGRRCHEGWECVETQFVFLDKLRINNFRKTIQLEQESEQIQDGKQMLWFCACRVVDF